MHQYPLLIYLQVFSNHLFLAVFAIYISIVASLSPMGLELGLGDHLPAAFVGAQLRLMLTIMILEEQNNYEILMFGGPHYLLHTLVAFLARDTRLSS